MDRGAWWAIVHGVAKGQTRLSNFHFHVPIHRILYNSRFQANLLTKNRKIQEWYRDVY